MRFATRCWRCWRAWVLALALAASPSLAQAMSFQALLDPQQVVPLPGGVDPDGVSQASGILTLELNEAQTQLSYELVLDGLLLADVQAIHIHIDAPPGVNGPHGLNIFGLPDFDDDDMLPTGPSSLAGIWDDSDENFAAVGDPLVRDPGDSIKLTDALASILAGEGYIAIHTFDFPLPNTSELRGQILPVPEPGVGGLCALAFAGLLLGRRSPQA